MGKARMKLSQVLRARNLLFFAGLAATLISWRYTPIVRSQQEPAVIDTVASVRIRLGVNDTAPTDWSGSVNVTGGQLAGLRHWRPRPGDKVDGAAFTVATRTGAPFVYRAWEDAPLLPERPYLLTPGIIVDVKAARTALLRIETKHGAFEVSPFALEAGQSEKYLVRQKNPWVSLGSGNFPSE